MRRRSCVAMLALTGAAAIVVVAAACGDSYGTGDDPQPDVSNDAAPAEASKLDAGAEADADAADAAATNRCPPEKPFSTRVAIGSVSSLVSDSLPRLSPDELTIYFSSDRGRATNDYAIYFATRASAVAPFGPVSELATLGDGGSNGNPTLSPDALLVVFDSTRNGTRQLFAARRGTTLAAFDTPFALSGTESVGTEFHPFLVSELGEVWFVSTRTGVGHIFRADLVDGGVNDAGLVPSLASAANEWAPVVSADGLEIYFASTRGGPKTSGFYDIHRATRASRSDPFGDASPVVELNTPALDLPGWLSPDGCRLYFISGAPNVEDIYVGSK